MKSKILAAKTALAVALSQPALSPLPPPVSWYPRHRRRQPGPEHHDGHRVGGADAQAD